MYQLSQKHKNNDATFRPQGRISLFFLKEKKKKTGGEGWIRGLYLFGKCMFTEKIDILNATLYNIFIN